MEPTTLEALRVVIDDACEGQEHWETVLIARAVWPLFQEARAAAVAPYVAALRKCATVIVSAGPALIRATNQSPNEQARSLSALLEGTADQAYREARALLDSAPPVREPEAGGLRVERLARALQATPHGTHYFGSGQLGSSDPTFDELYPAAQASVRDDARRIAAAYTATPERPADEAGT